MADGQNEPCRTSSSLPEPADIPGIYKQDDLSEASNGATNPQ